MSTQQGEARLPQHRPDSPTRQEGLWVPAPDVPLFLHNGYRVAQLEDGLVYDAERALLVPPAQREGARS